DQIIEVIQSRPDIRSARYLSHKGLIFEHDEITPVSFFREKLFGESPLFPVADAITLVGGVFNSTGGGCLNAAFDYLIRYQQRIDHPCAITIPVWATYQASGELAFQDIRDNCQYQYQVEQVTKDLVWKMLIAKISFELIVDNDELITCGQDPFVKLKVSTKSKNRFNEDYIERFWVQRCCWNG
ncbi:MAG: hypothetical protein ACE5PV_18530, partial [Candidatus Poribacteria bacterium]